MALRLLAKQIARKGTHVLRFDYHGIGDSFGELDDVQTLQQWESNITTAVDHLRQVCGANSVMLLGLRTGASLAHRVAKQTSSINSLLLWEPVIDGHAYLESLRAIHREMLDLWVCKMKTEDSDRAEELLGSVYSRSLVRELESMKIDLSDTDQPHAIVATKDAKLVAHHDEPSLQKVIEVEDADRWDDLQEFETAWLRSLTTRTIVNTVDDMFNRLEKFGVLSSPIPSLGFASSAQPIGAMQ
jgi:pimeloyl-ACP methyl ester carboxylesterase